MKSILEKITRLSSIFLLLALTLASAQLPRLPEIKVDIPGLDKILQQDPAITTNINDAVYEVPFLDSFDPVFYSVFTDRPSGPDNGAMLAPGLYESLVQSYCLKAGTYGPSKGDGYSYAPLKGQFAKIVQSIIQGSIVHKDIEQRDIQVLLWAIIARTKLSDMSTQMQTTAAKLLTPKQLFDVNGGALGLVPQDRMSDALGDLPPQVQQVLRAEAELREMLTTTEARYEDLERVAVLTGIAPEGEGSRMLPRGRWSLRPDGFFARYFPQGYPKTLVQIYVPERFDIERDAQGRITRVIDLAGNRIDFEYDEGKTPVAIPGDPKVKGFAFRRIHFLWREIDIPEAVLDLEAEWQNVGWTLVGVPTEKGKPGQQSVPFNDLPERYKFAVTHNKQLKELDKQYKPKGSTNDIIDLAHLSYALDMVIGNRTEQPVPWAAEHAYLLKKAWQYMVAKRECGINGEDLIEYKPWGNTAMPGNTSSQRIETSLRPANQEDEKEKACATIKKKLNDEQILLAAYENLDILARALEHGMDWELYDAAVMNLAEFIYNNGGLGSYDPNSLTPDQIDGFFTSTPAPAGNATTQTAMSTAGDGSIWGYNTSGNKVMIIDNNGNIVQNNYNSALNNYRQQYGWTAGEKLFGAALAHEMTHSKQAKTEGFTDSPGQHRRFEMAAYKAGIEKKKQALEALGCD